MTYADTVWNDRVTNINGTAINYDEIGNPLMNRTDKEGRPVHYVYLVECRDGSLYCGYTPRLEDRIRAHNAGEGAKYTKSRRPVTLVYHEEYEEKSDALRREWAIKRLTRREKLALIAEQKAAR